MPGPAVDLERIDVVLTRQLIPIVMIVAEAAGHKGLDLLERRVGELVAGARAAADHHAVTTGE